MVVGIDIGSAIVGFLLTVIVSPLISKRVTQAYQDLGVYREPALSIHARISSDMYKKGASVSKYGGLEWKDTFKEYRVTIKNEEQVEAENVRSNLNFPGPVIAINRNELGGGRFRVNNSSSVELTRNGREYVDTLYCSQTIWAEQLLPENTIQVEFIVDHDTSRGEHFVDLDPSRKFSVSFEWVNGGVRFDSEESSEIEGVEEIYKWTLFKHAGESTVSGSSREGVEFAEKALEIDPDFHPAVLQKGVCEIESGKQENDLETIEAGIGTVSRAISMRPSHKEQYRHKATAELLLHNLTKDKTNYDSEEYRKSAIDTLESACDQFNHFSAGKRLLDKIRGGKTYESPEGLIAQNEESLELEIEDESFDEISEVICLLDYSGSNPSQFVRIFQTPAGDLVFQFQSAKKSGECVVNIDELDGTDVEKIQVHWSKGDELLEVHIRNKNGTVAENSDSLRPKDEREYGGLPEYLRTQFE